MRVALVWLWCGFGVPIGWLSVGFEVALGWLWGGFGGALVEPWWSLGGALGWLCTPESMPSICLLYGFAVALGGFARPPTPISAFYFLLSALARMWLWVALPGLSAFCLLVLRNSIA